MKYITFILYILLLLILITLFYNKMQKEHFIESLTEMCNTRKKLNSEPCLKNIQGDPGIKGIIGKERRQEIQGNPGDDGIPGMNGLDAREIGTLNFRDNIENDILRTTEYKNRRTKDNKITNIKLLRGNQGDNARMNPITFIDSETKKVISKQYTENWDLPEIRVPIQKGDKGIEGKDAVCTIPGERGIKESNGDRGTEGHKGDEGIPINPTDQTEYVIENPEFELITTDKLCANDLCIDLDMFKEIYEHISTLRAIVEKEQEYNKAIRDLSNTAAAESSKYPTNTNEQFTNFEDTNCDNSEYCTKTIRGDRGNPGKEGDRGFDAMKGPGGIRGMRGFNGIDGEEIPNIDFIDKNTEILLGKYKSFDENAKTEKIYLKNGKKGQPGYIPNIIFKYKDDTVESHTNTDDTINESNNNKDDIIVYLDNSKGERGNNGIDGICEISEKGEPVPQNANPTYNKVIADKYCFSHGILSDICLDKILLSKLINSKKNNE